MLDITKDKTLYVLHSGYVTYNTGRLNRISEKEKNIQDRILTKRNLTLDYVNYYDEGIEKLFQLWRKNDKVMLDFGFREKVLTNAIRVFHGLNESFTQWLGYQQNQRTVGYLHRQFILDTLKRIYGDGRTMEVYNYYTLLNARLSSNKHQTTKGNLVQDLKDCIQEDSSFSYLLTTWGNNISGYSDMLASLHVIFGKRDRIAE